MRTAKGPVSAARGRERRKSSCNFCCRGDSFSLFTSSMRAMPPPFTSMQFSRAVAAYGLDVACDRSFDDRLAVMRNGAIEPGAVNHVEVIRLKHGADPFA